MTDKEVSKAANRLLDQETYKLLEPGTLEKDALIVAQAYKKLLKEKK